MTLGPVMLDVAVSRSPRGARASPHPLTAVSFCLHATTSLPNRLRRWCARYTSCASRIARAVDHEGGRVQRFREALRTCAVARFGELYDEIRSAAGAGRDRRLADGGGMRAVGVDFSFAPVLDVNRGISGDRRPGVPCGPRRWPISPCYMTDAPCGMAATGKHFPPRRRGGGFTCASGDERRYQDIYMEDVVPFERMIHYAWKALCRRM